MYVGSEDTRNIQTTFLKLVEAEHFKTDTNLDLYIGMSMFGFALQFYLLSSLSDIFDFVMVVIYIVLPAIDCFLIILLCYIIWGFSFVWENSRTEPTVLLCMYIEKTAIKKIKTSCSTKIELTITDCLPKEHFCWLKS